MRSRRTAAVAVLLLAPLALAGCTSAKKGPSGGAGSGSGSGAVSQGTNPLQNPDGTKPGLAPVTADADKKAGRDLIAQVKTADPGPKTGYDRDQFGPAWTDNVDGVPMGHNNCGTRDDVLARDGKGVEHKDGSACVVTAMTIWDPYTGKTVQWTKQQPSKIQIDHVMPLSYDWQQGASQWDKAKRVQIANDPLNLIPADGSQNASKGDAGPATWLPANTEIRCSYAIRWAQVSLKYQLPVTPADKKTMLALCGG
ncbi:HNH endonuclease family protein [Kitasatospora sp. YST-16]|uniref:HNH endonuclease family protein n=1 Tax=Kitasatospora sp. YST-16 TaxID=2998080 RepID=UPI002285216A|nr:HNH endonuclease family protein [Kitasatospora sp. YST-16]WAL71216.1 HNH endonuclease family protein [Kitasatospora sp. YST-16]WNW37252.1 HNH endonuclease family protein [Streptomyces sp. Li-HN-5-13]